MAVSSFPELADLVGADLYAGSALWRYPEIDTCVLRICYTLGPAHVGTLAAYLRGPRGPLGKLSLIHLSEPTRPYQISDAGSRLKQNITHLN